MLTLDIMQNNSTLMWKKFEIWSWSILKVIKAFNTVHIVLYIVCSGPVIGLSTHTYWFYLTLDFWARTPDIQNYAYSMKSLNNF